MTSTALSTTALSTTALSTTALRRLLAVAATTGVLLTGAACGSDDSTMTPTDTSSTMTDHMSESPMTEKSDGMSESPMTGKSDDMVSESPMSDPSASMSDDMSDK